jgi:hypothetical protein
VEGVEPPSRAVATEVSGVDVVEAGAVEELAELGAVLVAQLLLDAVGAEAGDRASDVETRLGRRADRTAP